MVSSVFIFTCFLTSVSAQYGYSEPSVVLKDEETGRIRGFSNTTGRDFYLGGLMRVHFHATEAQCDSAFPDRGLEEVEAMLFAIDSINNDPDLLPNITLGYDIRDYCGTENIAIDEAFDWALSSSMVTSSQECPVPRDSEVTMQTSILAAVIGAIHSRVSGPVATFLRPFEIPQISPASGSAALSNHLRYSYFLRTVPPNTVASKVMLSIVLSQGWTVVSAIHSNELYGEHGIEEFRVLNRDEVGVCLDLDEGINEDFDEVDYVQLAQRLYNSSTNVVLVFALETYLTPLLRQIKRIQPPKRFVFITTDGWSESSQMHQEFGELLVGMLVGVVYAPIPEEFNQYYEQVTPSTNKRDPYFSDYCKSFLLNTQETCTNDTSITSADGYSPGLIAPLTIQAVYSVAHGLQDFFDENCDSPVEWNRTTQSCKGQNLTLNGSVLLDYILRVNFTVPGTDARVAFNELGDPAVDIFEILNFQKKSNGRYGFVIVGSWDSVNGVVFNSSQEIHYGLTNDGGILHGIESRCPMCNPGEVEMPLEFFFCCKLCVPCTGPMYANHNISNETCLHCGMHMWGNNPDVGSDGCVTLKEVYVNYDNAWGIVIIVLAVIGLVSVATVSVIIGLFFWTNPVIKSFGREQLVLILIGIALCFIFPFYYVFKPSLGLCVTRWLGFWFSLTLIFAALLIKLIRVTRIFRAGITGGLRYFIKPWHQVFFTFLVVGGQMVLAVISVSAPPLTVNSANTTKADEDFPIIVVTCANPHIATLILLILYNSVLVILINGFAVFTIQFPKNFNEARNIAFATFSIGVVWIAFIPVYFATSNEYQSGSIALAMMCMAFSILASLILPRLYTALINSDSKVTSTQMSTNLERSLKTMTTEDVIRQELEKQMVASSI